MPHQADLEAALAAARGAGDLIRREYETFVAIPDASVSITTHVDLAAQESIVNSLKSRFPQDGICAEEATAGARTHSATRVWVVDPIDGTRGFARKTGQFSVMIGLLVRGEPTVGVVLEPAQNRITYASDGMGCWVEVAGSAPRRCTVSSRNAFAESIVTRSWSSAQATVLFEPAGVIETYSGGVKLALVARGEADIYANTYDRFYDWDIGAGHILVAEAGGRVTDLSGKAIAYGAEDASQRRGLLATNGLLHDLCLEKSAKRSGTTPE